MNPPVHHSLEQKHLLTSVNEQVLMKEQLEHKLRIFETVILNTKWKDCISRKKLQKKNLTYTKRFHVHDIAAVNLSKIYFLKNAKKT